MKKSAYLIALLVLLLFVPQSQAQNSTPNAQTGYEIFENRCANCHGSQGAGDGEMAANLPQPPPSFLVEGYIDSAVPSELFDTITNGRIMQGMPLFGEGSSNPISEANRWDVIAAIYALATPAERLEAGEAVYVESCSACHGEAGDNAEAPLTDLAYWFTQSNNMIASQIVTHEAHAFDLTNEELLTAVAFARTFNYETVALGPQVIETAQVFGAIVNGTTNETVGDLTATLRAFTPDLQEALSLETEVGANGRYMFDLSLIPDNWIYLVTVHYNDVSFSSGANQLNVNNPSLELPITVYDTTTDASNITIERLHTVILFSDDAVQVSELYLFNNLTNQVYVGETGNPNDGTLQVHLPTGAEGVRFQRGIGDFESFMPVNSMRQTELGWAETEPIQPGQGTANLLVQYELPFQPSLTIAHPVLYQVESTTALLPDTGVTLTGADWLLLEQETPPDTAPSLFYQGEAISAGDPIRFELDGTPTLVVNEAGSAVLVRDETQELVVGIIFLLCTLAVAGYFLREWRLRQPADPQQLLAAIAELDMAYEQGNVKPQAYVNKRQKLKAQLQAVWSEHV